jgi:hypothetical protein
MRRRIWLGSISFINAGNKTLNQINPHNFKAGIHCRCNNKSKSRATKRVYYVTGQCLKDNIRKAKTAGQEGKVIPVQGCERLRFPHFQTFGSQMAVRLSALRVGHFLPPGRFLVLISVRGWVDPRGIVQLERLGKLKKSTSSGTRTGDLPACSLVLHPTTLPRAPNINST